jgi:hypothetical protein
MYVVERDQEDANNRYTTDELTAHSIDEEPNTDTPLFSEDEEDTAAADQPTVHYDVYFVECPSPDVQQDDTSIPATTPRKRPRIWIVWLAAVIITALLSGVATAIITYLPTATVTIIAQSSPVSVTSTINARTDGQPQTPGSEQQLAVRSLSTLTLTQARMVPTTGTGHQDAQSAHGLLTFYNALPIVQTIPAGELLTGTDGVQIVTDQDAVIPAAALPIVGQVTVSAHALQVGPGGNMSAYDINGPCCRAYVLVKNTSAFTGGQLARSYPMVTQEDINTATTTLKTSITQSVQAALQAELKANETLIAPFPCTPTISSDHTAGQEATQVTIIMQETCTGLAYDTQALHAIMSQMINQEATRTLGIGYGLIGEIQTSIVQTTVKGQTITLQVKATGRYAYQFTQDGLERLKKLIAGQQRGQAVQTLLHQSGVSSVSINVTGAQTDTLPIDTTRIKLLILYMS